MVSSFVWQMLLPINVADILPLQCIATIGRLILMSVADGIATCCLLFMFCFMDIKSEGEIEEALYKKLYPTGAGSPKFYGLSKIHKEGIPLRPILSSIGAAGYETAKELAKILKPLVGKSMYHVHNTQDFIQQIKDIKLQKDQCMVSFDVKALFTSVPIRPAINTIKKLLEEDPVSWNT